MEHVSHREIEIIPSADHLALKNQALKEEVAKLAAAGSAIDGYLSGLFVAPLSHFAHSVGPWPSVRKVRKKSPRKLRGIAPASLPTGFKPLVKIKLIIREFCGSCIP